MRFGTQIGGQPDGFAAFAALLPRPQLTILKPRDDDRVAVRLSVAAAVAAGAAYAHEAPGS